jgi:hypothetical protein
MECSAALETHGFPRPAPIKRVRPRASSCSLVAGSGEGQSRGKTRARERKLLVGERAWRQSTEKAAGFVVLHHEVDGSAELVGENGKGLGLAVFFSKLLPLCRRSAARVGWREEKERRLRRTPTSNARFRFLRRRCRVFSRRAFLTLDESSIGSEVLDALESSDIVNLVEHGHGENLTDTGNGAESERSCRGHGLRPFE